MATERRVVAKYDVLHYGLPRPDRFEEIPEMRLQIVVVIALKAGRFRERLLPRFGIMFRVPLLEVRFPQPCRKSVAVVTGSRILARFAANALGQTR